MVKSARVGSVTTLAHAGKRATLPTIFGGNMREPWLEPSWVSYPKTHQTPLIRVSIKKLRNRKAAWAFRFTAMVASVTVIYRIIQSWLNEQPLLDPTITGGIVVALMSTIAAWWQNSDYNHQAASLMTKHQEEMLDQMAKQNRAIVELNQAMVEQAHAILEQLAKQSRQQAEQSRQQAEHNQAMQNQQAEHNQAMLDQQAEQYQSMQSQQAEQSRQQAEHNQAILDQITKLVELQEKKPS